MNLLDPLQEEKLSFYYGEEKISFYRQAQSQSRRITIEIDRNHRIIVRAPCNASDITVIQAVKKRARWISQQLKTLRQQDAHLISRHYISGESHFYLGRRYQLKIFPIEINNLKNNSLSSIPERSIIVKKNRQNNMKDPFNSNNELITDLFDPIYIAMIDQLKKVAIATQQNPPPNQEVSNNDLSNIHFSHKRESQEYVRRWRNLLEIYTIKTEKSHIAALLNDWYRTQAESYFQKRLFALTQKLPNIHQCPHLELSWMEEQWGEYDAKRNIFIFNIHLIKADQEIIDYVILCELLRFITHNGHNNHYLPLLRQYCPKWHTISTRLEKMAGHYLQ